MMDMKFSDMEKKDRSEVSVLDDKPSYPYGLKVSLDGESFKKLNIKVPQVGEKMMLHAMVYVSSVSIEDSKGDEKEVYVQLQITDMELEAGQKKTAEQVLY